MTSSGADLALRRSSTTERPDTRLQPRPSSAYSAYEPKYDWSSRSAVRRNSKPSLNDDITF